MNAEILESSSLRYWFHKQPAHAASAMYIAHGGVWRCRFLSQSFDILFQSTLSCAFSSKYGNEVTRAHNYASKRARCQPGRSASKRNAQQLRPSESEVTVSLPSVNLETQPAFSRLKVQCLQRRWVKNGLTEQSAKCSDERKRKVMNAGSAPRRKRETKKMFFG